MTTTLTNRGIGLLVICSFSFLLEISSVSIRLTRNFSRRILTYEDGLIFVAALIGLTNSGILITAVTYGTGQHIYNIHNPDSLFHSIYLPWLVQPIFAASLLLAKASVGCALLRLGLGRAFNAIIISGIFVALCSNGWALISVVAGCHPSMASFTGEVAPCIPSGDTRVASYVQAAANILTDFTFVFAPEYFLRSVKLSSRDRMAVRCLLGFMLLASILSAVKASCLPLLFSGRDITWDVVPVAMTTTAEVSLTILASCLPALRQVLGPHFPKQWRFWRSGGSTNDATYTNNDDSGYARGTGMGYPRGSRRRSVAGDSDILAPSPPPSLPDTRKSGFFVTAADLGPGSGSDGGEKDGESVMMPQTPPAVAAGREKEMGVNVLEKSRTREKERRKQSEGGNANAAANANAGWGWGGEETKIYRTTEVTIAVDVEEPMPQYYHQAQPQTNARPSSSPTDAEKEAEHAPKGDEAGEAQ